MKAYVAYTMLLVFLASCFAGTERKSYSYYVKNRLAIEQIRIIYEALYQQQPFAAGFTDRSFKEYIMEVTTDTVRYVYNTEYSKEKLTETIHKFGYDTVVLRTLAAKMKEIKCLWLDKASFYLDGKKQTVTFISFKSALIEKPFVENKYFILVFLPEKIEQAETRPRVKSGEFVRIDDYVYYTIGNKFR